MRGICAKRFERPFCIWGRFCLFIKLIVIIDYPFIMKADNSFGLTLSTSFSFNHCNNSKSQFLYFLLRKETWSIDSCIIIFSEYPLLPHSH